MATAYLVSEILQLISDLRGESSTDTSASRIRAISRGERDLAKRKFFRIHLVKNQTVATGDGSTVDFTIGTDTYPMRMKGLSELFVGGLTEDKRIGIIDFNDYKLTIAQNAGARVGYEYYDQANKVWKAHINPTPQSSDTIYASWFYMPPVRTLTTEYVLTDDPYVIAYLALADIYHGEDELQLEQLARQEAETRTEELMGTEEMPAENQIYQMKPSERKGYGNY